MLLLLARPQEVTPVDDRPLQQPRTARYRPIVVWSTGTDQDSSAYDDVSGQYLNQPGLQLDGIGRDQIRAYSPPAAPSFDLTLTNWDARFSPGSPIGPLVTRGSATRLELTWGQDRLANGREIPADSDDCLANGYRDDLLFDGVLDTVEYALTRPQRSVALRALGHLAYLQNHRPITTQLYGSWTGTPFRTDQAITIILDQVGWPADMRSIDTGDTLLEYWWLDGQTDALAALNDLLGAEGAGGCMYEQRGVFHFEGRQFRANNIRSTEAQWIFSDGFVDNPNANSNDINAGADGVLANGDTGRSLLTDVIPASYFSNPDEVVTSVSAAVNIRTAVPTQVGDPTPEVGKIWEYGGPLILPDATPVDVIQPVSDPYRNALTPVLGTDYVLAAGSAALASVALLSTSGIAVRLRWTAATAAGCIINGNTSNGPQVRAVSLPVTSERIVQNTVSTAAYAARYAGKAMQMAMWPEVLPSQALDIVNSMTQRYRQERRQATITLANIDARHMRAILDARVSDRLTWVRRRDGINDPYWIEQIAHDISPGGGLHRVTLGIERVFTQIGGRFDTARFDTTGRFGE